MLGFVCISLHSLPKYRTKWHRVGCLLCKCPDDPEVVFGGCKEFSQASQVTCSFLFKEWLNVLNVIACTIHLSLNDIKLT